MVKPQTTLTLASLRGEGREKGMCKAGRIIRELSVEDRITINEALSGPEYEFPSGKIAGALGGAGFFVSTDSLIKHRRNLCACKSF